MLSYKDKLSYSKMANKNIQTEINKIKKRLIKKATLKGLYENFGQKEFRSLMDKYGEHMYDSLYKEGIDLIFGFNNWCMNYTN